LTTGPQGGSKGGGRGRLGRSGRLERPRGTGTERETLLRVVRVTLNAGPANSPGVSPPSSTSSTDVDAYLAAVPPKFRKELEKLRRTIRSAAPDAEERISYGMPAFRQGGMLVYYAAFQDHLSFFVGSPGARNRFAAELKPFETGKGTVRFTPDRPLPAGLVRRIVKARVAENVARNAKKTGRARRTGR
jgi:uncharacterized protein YdhG (YjbR/CyaY superfamily)